MIVERTKAGIAAARARGRNGGAPFKMTTAKLCLAQAAMGQPETKIAPLCRELGITIMPYTSLASLKLSTNGPVDPAVNIIAEKRTATPCQVLLAWAAKETEGVVVT